MQGYNSGSGRDSGNGFLVNKDFYYNIIIN